MTDLFTQHERAFLEAKARDWGWRDDNAKIFVQRMLRKNNHYSHEQLNDKVLEIADEDGACIGNKVADTLCNNIMPKLRETEASFKARNWRDTQEWLKTNIFPEWVKPKAWEGLWSLSEPNPEIAVEIIKKPLTGAPLPPDEYAPRRVPLGANVCYQIPMTQGEHLILLEKDGNGDIYCLRPSKHPSHKIGEPVAISEVIAIVSSTRPEIEWLATAASHKSFLAVEYQQIESLMNWVKQPQHQCQVWQFEVEIVMPKIEPVVTVTF
jgi:hypothetical protein